jgi:HD-GYP domain-containing protein (c-di-GMP phosphodiesterase class II)/DNA-binding CsgD family transcriptional regulator
VATITLDERLPTLRVLRGGREPEGGAVATTAAALEAALKTRAPALHASTPLVRKLAVRVSRRLGLDEQEEQMVDVCAQLRDVGMIGLPDSAIFYTGPLSPADWTLLNCHPERGAELLESLPGMGWAAELVRAHHERWDGDGYPDGLRGEAIPLPSRVVAVCDAFVAVATDRSHRRGAGAEGALELIAQERGGQFDPAIVDCLVATLTGKDDGRPRAVPHKGAGKPHPPQHQSSVCSRAERVSELRPAIVELDVLPVFGPACDRALTAASYSGPLGRGQLISAIESDIGLTVATLRLAQARGRTTVAGVTAAVARLGPEEIRAAIAGLPRLSFPWQTSFEALLHRCAVHAQAVARSADRLSQMLRPFDRDDVVTAALVHDVGKLLLALIWPDFAAATPVHHTPEELVARERRELGYDHATLGGLLMERWGLPSGLTRAVSAHHSAHRATEAAALVRLADMVVRHAHGDAVDRHAMLRLAAECELSTNALRELVFDLPHPSGSARRRAERSPLSTRESAILRLLVEGMRNAEIARELRLTESTVRSHLHNTYAKLEVPDRAQAVLKATEMGWL